MLKRWLIITALFFIVFSAFVFSQEAQECSNVPQGYKYIEGQKGATAYNPEDIEGLFGVPAQEDNGALKIKYNDARGRARELGYLRGKIIKTHDNYLDVSACGTYFAYFLNVDADTRKEVKGNFGLNATEARSGRFVFSLLEKSAFFIDEDKNRDTPLDIKAVASRQNGADAIMSPDSLRFNIRDAGIVFGDDANKYVNEQEISSVYAEVKNLNEVSLLPANPDVSEQVIEISAATMDDFSSSFGDIKVRAPSEVELKRSGLRRSANLFSSGEAYDSVYASDADVLIAGNADIVRIGNSGIVRVFLSEQRPLLELNSGRVAVSLNENSYRDCMRSFGVGVEGSCMWIDQSAGKISLRTALFGPDIIGLAGAQADFNAVLLDPALQRLNMLYFGGFIGGDTVAVKKGVNLLIFGNDLVEIQPVGDWFEFGLSFSTYPISYRDEETGRLTDYRFRCDIATRKCYFVTLQGSEQEVVSFTERKPVQCRQDADCGNGKICAEFRCRTPVTCDKLIEGGSVDLLFVSEGYTDYTVFKNDVRELLESPSARGLFTVSPFDEIRSRFTVWTVLGSTSQQKLDAKGVSAAYLRDYEAQCSNDISIALSRKQVIRAHANFYSKKVATTMMSLDPALVFVHEMGHAYAGLKDEYLTPATQDDPELPPDANLGGAGYPNCLDESNAISEWGRAQWGGCGGDCNQDTDECPRLGSYYRPDENSIMRNQHVSGAQFNEVSKQAIRNAGAVRQGMDPMLLERMRQTARGR